MMADIRVTFVLPDHVDDKSHASEMMVHAYDSCKQLVNNVSWVKEANLASIKFTKLDYVVFENFEGRNFTKFLESKCAVVGPLAISVCQMEGKPIPSFQWPILNVAMYGCEITCSQVSKSNKEEIKKKVQLMGGFYTGDLIDSVTHLICNGTKSEKYMLAAEMGIKLMLPSWIDHLFETSKTNNVSASNPKIMEKFKCPPLYNLTICSTGITSSKEKTKLSELISANGGRMEAKLVLSKTDILICHGLTATTSEKYKAACNTPHISCVTIEWIFDSIDKGYALPREKYRVKTTTSTPTKEGENIDPNFSTVSAIGGAVGVKRSQVDETGNVSEMSLLNEGPSAVYKISKKRKADDDLVEALDIKKIKNAGNFLDGCSVFVCGFNHTRRDKLNKIINISGATRYDDFSERVSHVIVGDPTCQEVASIKELGLQCSLVTVQWLLDSVDQQKPVDEENYLVLSVNSGEANNISSPLSKKVVNFLRGDKTLTARSTSNIEDLGRAENDDPLTNKYLTRATSNKKDEDDTLAKLLGNQNNPITIKSNEDDAFSIRTRPLMHKKTEDDSVNFQPQDTSTEISQVTTDLSESDIEVLPIFNSCKFIVDGFNAENTITFKKYIAAAGGSIVDKRFKGICDYVVFPIVKKSVKLPPAQEIVNELWLIYCIENKMLCTDIQYYHRSIELQSTLPLKGCVISTSGYSGDEREFLKSVIEGLGGIFQEQFSRKTRETRNVLASTHLISPKGSGNKYDAALKWNLPIITKDWLLECAKTGKQVPLQAFLIGESERTEKPMVNDTDTTFANSNQNNANITQSGERIDYIAHNKLDEDKNVVSTPKGHEQLEGNAKTPLKQIYNFDQKGAVDACSQVTPINKILQDAIDNKVLPTPPSPKTYYPWNPKTPDTPIGSVFTPNPSPGLRKELQKYLDSFPEFVPPKRRLSTPLSELKKRLMDRVLGRGEYSQKDPSTSSQVLPQDVQDGALENQKETCGKGPSVENVAVQQKLQELQQRVMASGSSSATKRSSRMFESSTNLPELEKQNIEVQSQVCTVGWDYGEEKSQNTKQKIFMVSGVDLFQREQLTNHLQTLGAVVSELSNYESGSTHLICPKPGRNEKTLACMASGKWILHVSYVEKSVAAGHFLNEEEFEFGNPKAQANIFCEEKDSSIYFWRKEIARRGYGAFNDMRAIVIAEKKEPIAKVIEAGGGVVLNIMPPFHDPIHATHCLLEIKMVKDFSKYVVLAQQGIKCVNTIYINDFLWRIKKDDVDYIIPYLSTYYK